MTLKVQKWGNSLAIRIPSAMAKEARLRHGTTVELSDENGGLVLRRKTRMPKYFLKELVDGITPENMHPYIDDGGPVGKERFWESE